MKIYDEITDAEITAPDMEKGTTYPGRRLSGTIIEKLAGTVTPEHPNGLRKKTPVYEECLFYHTYTAEEQAAREQASEPSQLDRVEAQAIYTAMMTDTLLEV